MYAVKWIGMTILEGFARLFAGVCLLALVGGPFVMLGVLGLLIQRATQ